MTLVALCVRRALSRCPRDSFFLATKFPGYDLSNMGKVEEIFEKQLEANLHTFEADKPLNTAEMDALMGVVKEMLDEGRSAPARPPGGFL